MDVVIVGVVGCWLPPVDVLSLALVLMLLVALIKSGGGGGGSGCCCAEGA